ncbi:MAG: tetratricopeptide repeat protein [Candidatus Odinarchaeota archaeon]
MPDQDNNGLERISSLFQRGEFNEALETVKKLKQIDLTSRIDHYTLEYWKIRILVKLGRFKESLESIAQIIPDIEKLNMIRLLADIHVVLAEAYWRTGKFDDVLATVERGKQILSSMKKDQLLNIPAIKAGLLHYEGGVYWQKGDYTKALENFRICLELRKEHGNKSEIAESLNSIGLVLWQKGKLDQALNYYQQSLDLREEIGNQRDIATSLNNIGLVLWNKGDLNLALEYYFQSLTIFRKTDDELSIASLLNNIGLICHDKGDLDEALEFHLKSLEIREKGPIELDRAISLHNVGLIYRQKGFITQSLEFYHKCLEIEKKIGNDYFISDTLLHLIEVATDNSNNTIAKQYLDYLQQINARNGSNVVSQRYRVAQALVLKTDSRLRNRIKAEELLEQVCSEEILESSLTVTAMLHLTDLLLQELRISGNEELFKEVKDLINRLLQISEQQKSHSLLVEAYLLQAKLSIVELNLKRARSLFIQAQIMAEEKGLQRLAMKISSEHDALIEQLNKWEQAMDQESSLIERLEIAGLDQVVQRMKQEKTIELPEISREEPVLFLIISKNGVTLFSRVFYREISVNDQIIGGLLTAVYNFSSEIFSRQLDRIKIGEYILIMRPEESLLIGYVFKGQSYYALQKMDLFVTTLRSFITVKTALLSDGKQGKPVVLTTEVIETLKKITDRIFLDQI